MYIRQESYPLSKKTKNVSAASLSRVTCYASRLALPLGIRSNNRGEQAPGDLRSQRGQRGQRGHRGQRGQRDLRGLHYRCTNIQQGQQQSDPLDLLWIFSGPLDLLLTFGSPPIGSPPKSPSKVSSKLQNLFQSLLPPKSPSSKVSLRPNTCISTHLCARTALEHALRKGLHTGGFILWALAGGVARRDAQVAGEPRDLRAHLVGEAGLQRVRVRVAVVRAVGRQGRGQGRGEGEQRRQFLEHHRRLSFSYLSF